MVLDSCVSTSAQVSDVQWVLYTLTVYLLSSAAGCGLQIYLTDYTVYLCLKFPVASIYDLSDVVNLLSVSRVHRSTVLFCHQTNSLEFTAR